MATTSTQRHRWTYDVFVSFRGEDIRKSFTDHLFKDFEQKGIRLFRDDKDLTPGEEISPNLNKAIQESRFLMVIFSKNYASSSWCLRELVKILECNETSEHRHEVRIIFYGLKRDVVRRQTRSYAEYELSNRTEVAKWKDALFKAATLSGWEIQDVESVSESEFISSISEEILKVLRHERLHVGKNLNLFVSDKVIGKGSNGTIVLEGTYDTRPAAVKRIMKAACLDAAVKEIKNLRKSDQHPNIVRYYGAEEDRDFVYIALERCVCSLHELVLSSTNSSTVQLKMQDEGLSDFKLLNTDGHPSLELLKVMRDTITGLAHLHKLGFIHRDLKPQNVLILKDKSISAKLSDMSISKLLPADTSSLTKSATGYGSSGWQAPEQLRVEEQTQAVDLFSFGCVLFFCITRGQHPFGDMHERDMNILKDHKDLSLVDDIPEAFDLISNLLHPDPKFRPKAAEVYNHPLFWNSEMRLSFLQDASDRVESEARVTDSNILKSLKSIDTDVLGGNWDKKLHVTLVENLKERRKYKYNSVGDLLRAIRNKRHHYTDLSKELQDILGPIPIGFNYYFSSWFPKLLMEVYKILQTYRGKEDLLDKYYKQEVGELQA